VEFTEEHDGYSALSENGRRWRIWSVLTGWQMELRDPNDRQATYAGTFGTLASAQVEAARSTRAAMNLDATSRPWRS
jgi:hypothetical protein